MTNPHENLPECLEDLGQGLYVLAQAVNFFVEAADDLNWKIVLKIVANRHFFLYRGGNFSAILHIDEIACLNFVTAWSRQQERRSVKGPDTFRLSSFLVGSNVRGIVSLGLATNYLHISIYSPWFSSFSRHYARGPGF